MGGCLSTPNSFTHSKTQEELVIQLNTEKSVYEEIILSIDIKTAESKIKPDIKITDKDVSTKNILELFIRGVCEVQIQLKTRNMLNLFELEKMLDTYFVLAQEKNEVNILIQQEEMRKWIEINKTI